MSQSYLINNYGLDRVYDVIELPNGSLRVITLWDMVEYQHGYRSNPYDP